MTTHTDDFHERLDGLARAATPGEWQNGIEDLEGVVAPQHPGLGNVVCIPPTDKMYSSYEHWPDNAAYIAAANPQAILKLIAENRAYREALDPFADIARREELHGSTIGHEDIGDDERGIVGFATLRMLGPSMGDYRKARAALTPIQQAMGDSSPHNADKGQANGSCNRTACQAPLAHEATHQFMDGISTGGPRLHYCERCALDFDKWDHRSGDRVRIKREGKQ